MTPLYILCLFDKSGLMGQPWADAGHIVKCMDIDNSEGYDAARNMFFVEMDLSDHSALFEYIEDGALNWGHPYPAMAISFPPRTDLANSGAKHFSRKRAKDPEFQTKALHLFRLGDAVADKYGIPGFTENPMSVASTLYRRRDVVFSPNEYGGYLPEDDVHPVWPEYIAPRDAYRKTTWGWTRGGFVMPEKKPVPLLDTGVNSDLARQGNSTQFLKLGGKSQKTKDIRSMTARGFAKGVFLTMEPILKGNQK